VVVDEGLASLRVIPLIGEWPRLHAGCQQELPKRMLMFQARARLASHNSWWRLGNAGSGTELRIPVIDPVIGLMALYPDEAHLSRFIKLILVVDQTSCHEAEHQRYDNGVENKRLTISGDRYHTLDLLAYDISSVSQLHQSRYGFLREPCDWRDQ
jgi:hypothetical protein